MALELAKMDVELDAGLRLRHGQDPMVRPHKDILVDELALDMKVQQVGVALYREGQNPHQTQISCSKEPRFLTVYFPLAS